MPNQYLNDASHFLDAEDLIKVDPTASVSDVLQKMSHRRSAGIIVYSKGSPAHYVNGRNLAEIVVREGAEDLTTYRKKLGEFIKKRPDEVGAVDFADVIDVKDLDTMKIELGNPANERAIYRIVSADVDAGWLFSHETFKMEAVTPPPVYVCSNPKQPHENTDPDTGRCSYCPFPLQTIK